MTAKSLRLFYIGRTCADPESARAGGGANSCTRARHVSLEDAEHLEATVGPRTVRAKHLPPAIQRRYGTGSLALQPSEVQSVRRVFEEAPARYVGRCTPVREHDVTNLL